MTEIQILQTISEALVENNTLLQSINELTAVFVGVLLAVVLAVSWRSY